MKFMLARRGSNEEDECGVDNPAALFAINEARVAIEDLQEENEARQWDQDQQRRKMQRDIQNRAKIEELLAERDALKQAREQADQEHQLVKQELKKEKKQLLEKVHAEVKNDWERIMLADSDSIQLKLKEMGFNFPPSKLQQYIQK